MNETITIVLPVDPGVFATFLLAVLTYLVYSIAKVAISLLKGA